MGASGALHGVSSSTIAIIFGFYQDLTQAVSNVLPGKREPSKNDYVLLTLVSAGLLAGLVTLAPLLAYLLVHHFIPTSSFLFGSLIFSASLGMRKIRSWRPFVILFFFLGAGASFSVTLLKPVKLPDNHFFTFLSGFISGLGSGIPGISGAFWLYLTGKFESVLFAFKQLKISSILSFSLGAVAGFSTMCRIISRIFTDYFSTAVALLAGLAIGALNKLWPWRQVSEYVSNSKGTQIPAYDHSIMPWNYLELTGKDPQVFQAILMMAVGVFIVALTEKIAARIKQKI